MHLSLWTVESRELIDEWSTPDFVKIPIEVTCSWQNLHQLSSERGHNIMNIKGKQIAVFCSECNSKVYMTLFISCDDDKDLLGDTVLRMAAYIISMMADTEECVDVVDYRSAILDCGWAIKSLLTSASRPCSLLPWALLLLTPQIVLVHLSPLLKACLRESLPTPLACLISRERQLASSPAWDQLPPIEQLCLTQFLRIHAPISDVIVRLPSQSDRPLYRLIQLELVPDVALLMLCGASASLDDIRSKVTQFWGPLMTELRSFRPPILQYAPLDSVPANLCAFFESRPDQRQCSSGFMETDDARSLLLDQSMKQLFLRASTVLPPSSLRLSVTVVVDRDKDVTFVVDQSRPGHSTVILAFDGRMDGIEARMTASDVAAKIDGWLEVNRQQ